jgi:hypothetical protein
MAPKKKTRKKSTKSKRTVRKKTAPVKTAKRPKKITKKKSAAKKAQKKKSPAKKQTRKKSGRMGALSFSARGPSRSGEQSGDLQGLSRLEAADSESVDELLEEGNAFEADVVAGVESADDADEKEVHTHEVPEDDVPEEYLDKE